MMYITFINILSTVSFNIFIGTVKQIVKFISTSPLSKRVKNSAVQKTKKKGGGRVIRGKKKRKPNSQCVSNCPVCQAT